MAKKKTVEAVVENVVESGVEAVKKTTKKVVKAADQAMDKAAEVAETAKKTVKRCKKPAVSYVLQYAGAEVDLENIAEMAKKEFEAMSDVAIKEIKIYVKPEDCAAYYVINDSYTGKVSLA